MTRTPQKPPTHPIKLKVPSYPILYPAAFRQRRFAAPSLRGEFGGPLDNKATTAGFDPVWGQDTRLAAGEETAPADNSPAAPNFIRQRPHTLPPSTMTVRRPCARERKNRPQKKTGLSRRQPPKTGGWHPAAVTKTANPAQPIRRSFPCRQNTCESPTPFLGLLPGGPEG